MDIGMFVEVFGFWKVVVQCYGQDCYIVSCGYLMVVGEVVWVGELGIGYIQVFGFGIYLCKECGF